MWAPGFAVKVAVSLDGGRVGGRVAACPITAIVGDGGKVGVKVGSRARRVAVAVGLALNSGSGSRSGLAIRRPG